MTPNSRGLSWWVRYHAYAIHLRMPGNRRALCSALWPLQFPREAATLWDLLKIASLGCRDCVSEFFPFQGCEDPEWVLEIRVLPSHGRTPAIFFMLAYTVHMDTQKHRIPSRELTYPKALFKIIFLFRRCDMWVPWIKGICGVQASGILLEWVKMMSKNNPLEELEDVPFNILNPKSSHTGFDMDLCKFDHW